MRKNTKVRRKDQTRKRMRTKRQIHKKVKTRKGGSFFNRTKKAASTVFKKAKKAASLSSGTMINRSSVMMNASHQSTHFDALTSSIDGIVIYAEDFLHLYKYYKILEECVDANKVACVNEVKKYDTTNIEATSQYNATFNYLIKYYYDVDLINRDSREEREKRMETSKNTRFNFQASSLTDEQLSYKYLKIYNNLKGEKTYTINGTILTPNYITDITLENGTATAKDFMKTDNILNLMKGVIRRLMNGFIYGLPNPKNEPRYSPMPIYNLSKENGLVKKESMDKVTSEVFNDDTINYIRYFDNLSGNQLFFRITDNEMVGRKKCLANVMLLISYLSPVENIRDTLKNRLSQVGDTPFGENIIPDFKINFLDFFRGGDAVLSSLGFHTEELKKLEEEKKLEEKKLEGDGKGERIGEGQGEEQVQGQGEGQVQELKTERNALAAEKTALAAEKTALEAEKTALKSERNALAAERSSRQPNPKQNNIDKALNSLKNLNGDLGKNVKVLGTDYTVKKKGNLYCATKKKNNNSTPIPEVD